MIEERTAKVRCWPGQEQILHETRYPEIGVVSGVGYGKSHLAVVKHHSLCRHNLNSKRSLFVAPKHDLLLENNIPLYESYLSSLGYLRDRDYRLTFNGNRPVLEYSWGHRVLFRSVGNLAVKKLVSYTVSHATCDEAGSCPDQTPIELSKRTRCPAANVLQICYYGTPEGVGNFFFRKFNPQVCERIPGSRFSVGPHSLVLHGRTYDNKILPSWYVDNIRREFAFNERLAMAYIEGVFCPLYDGACYDFDPDKHQQELNHKPFNDGRPLHLSWDFNVSRGRIGGVSWVVEQEAGRDIWIPAENKGGSRTTGEAVDNFIEQFPVREWKTAPIEVTGDASGDYRDTRQYGTDFDIIREKLRNAGYSFVKFKHPRGNPSESLRIAAVNRLFSDAVPGDLYVSPKCSKTVSSLLQTTVDDTGRIIKPSGDTHTHYADAVGYGVVQLRPVLKRGSGPIDFGYA